MNPKAQVQELLKLDGCTRPWQNEHTKLWECFNDKGNPILVRNYLGSYDAIIPLIQKQDEHTLVNMWPILAGFDPTMLHATPSQLAEILLRATGKWTV